MACCRSFYPRSLIGRFINFLEDNHLLELLTNLSTVAEELWLPSYILVHEQKWIAWLRQRQTIPTAITTHIRLGVCPSCAEVQGLIAEDTRASAIDDKHEPGKGQGSSKTKFSVKWQWRNHCKSRHKYFMRFIAALAGFVDGALGH